ncbi:MAG TPA: universal stress protein [Anaerolineales bacterium]|nr:universal stress protein [Anaerolineales bacterium]
MAGNISHKLSNSFEGALAGGGDPATSPLYVFGPFLRLIVVAGVAKITFGTSIWLVVLTIAVVSAMYRLVMVWVSDGSGGSGLSEDEFGSWAVKTNAAITFIEYTLTFLVSMAAMVTFIADRVPALNQTFIGIQYRTFVAIILSVITGWLVNRGPKTAARAFGPATAGVLLLLYTMIIASIWQYGLRLPNFDLRAFSGENLHITFGGFTRMLAVMTGIEVFANLVAAYDGTPEARGKKAFGSLLIIMGTTALTMVIVGPTIFELADPLNHEVSVFTQTMDILLPAPLPYIGTLIGIAVLLSASAAASQGIQNLALGLKDRRYIPAFMGERNKFDVADRPVWLQVGLVTVTFLLAGTNEETYLAIYAAGVFVLLSMTGWAAAKRLLRELKEKYSTSHLLTLIGTVVAAILTTGATIVIFIERFVEGAWTYFIFIPLLYAVFSNVRNRLGEPSEASERLGQLEEAMQGGFGFGQTAVSGEEAPHAVVEVTPEQIQAQPIRHWQQQISAPSHILVPLDGSAFAEQAIVAAKTLAQTYNAKITLVSILQAQSWFKMLPMSEEQRAQLDEGLNQKKAYLDKIAVNLTAENLDVQVAIRVGPVAETLNVLSQEEDIDLVVITTHGRSGVSRWLTGSVANRIIRLITRPTLVIRPVETAKVIAPSFKKVLVTLDGSEFAERVLPFVRASTSFESEIVLLSIPEIPEAQEFGAVVEEIRTLRQESEKKSRLYLESIAAALKEDGIHTRVVVTGSRPAETILSVMEDENVDLLMMSTHGRGGLDRLLVGSVAERIVQNTSRPVFLLPIHERRAAI